ncbi:hypothetical protein ALQ57_101575 [Pseudomonas amygdali pv. hibisci]|uniref:Uncharacterized protein n=3 Tax=Pseudomonas amygdali TaxID=47877 RepID=A0A0N8T2Z5_PSEAJ|nr:Unknown protein sequence [Pseudomonas amygdali pv. lachrymans]KPX52107.1 hypothetical protein ALO67_101551 [Pseudomonas amygdali pv. hibisci]KPY84168.1 hypothetical protein ALO60_101575 [Pseudomonas amygdali pv. tabaci]KPC18577.1 Unknown protein sequence [Pseudomonas amygdali pv. lachrymans]KPX77415.1 hypothetical protein ALO35_102040 [Pseudomonas amygdali pv. lachrymans]
MFRQLAEVQTVDAVLQALQLVDLYSFNCLARLLLCGSASPFD